MKTILNYVCMTFKGFVRFHDFSRPFTYNHNNPVQTNP